MEKTGHLRAYVLNTDHTFARVADVDTGMAGVMDASYDADLGRIWAHCDNTGGNATTLLKIGSDGHFAVEHDYSTPTGLHNYNLEGFTVAPASTATDDTREVLWTDDGNRFGHPLWSGTIDVDLGLTQSLTPDPDIIGTPTFGGVLTANVGTWDAGVTTHYQWKDGSTVLVADGPLTLSDPALVGTTITLAVTGTKFGYTADTTTVTAAVSSASLTAPTPTISGTPMVGRTLTATAAWGPGSVELGTSITVQVTGTEAGYVTRTVASSPTITARPGTIMTKRPTIDGTAKVGRKLTADAGHWSADGAAVDLAYKWYANGEVVRGETKAKLKLTKASDGKKINVRFIGSAEGYRTAIETSKATKKVG